MIDPELEDGRPDVSLRMTRQFAALCLGVFGTLFVLSAYRHGAPGAGAWVLLVLGVLIGLPGLVRPAVIRPVVVGAMALTRPIGEAMNVVLLCVLYYAVFTPIAVLFRLLGRDALRRRRPTGTTYWITKTEPTDVRQYFRQYQRQ